MKAFILTVGDEILIGQVTDTNATFMAAALTAEGIEVVEHLSVADSRTGILGGLERGLAAADVVLMTGGLGPTKDDITKTVLAEYFDTELVFHHESWERLQKIYRKFGREAGESHRLQCFLPDKADILTNKMGTAPGMLLRRGRKMVFSMPGVPYEMRYLTQEEVLPRLREYEAEGRPKLRSITLLTAGAGESMIAESIAGVEDDLPDHMSLAYLPNLGTVRLRLTARGKDEDQLQTDLLRYQTKIEDIIGPLVFGYGQKTLARAVGEELQKAEMTLGTTESCSGGRIAQMITAEAGASAYFHGGIVAYDNAVKTKLLKVSPDILTTHGAVSEETVTSMVAGGLDALETDLIVATTGIAGPGGGTETKPVGTIWIAVGSRERTVTQLLKAGKDRERNITYTAFQALNLVRRFLVGQV